MKGPRAAQRMLKELPARPKVSEEGFYSQVEKAVLDNPQQKGTGDQFLAQIQKTPGVKPEELQYTGLDTFLAGRPSVTKAEIQDFLDTNRVQLQEVQLGGVLDSPEVAPLRTRFQELVDLEESGVVLNAAQNQELTDLGRTLSQYPNPYLQTSLEPKFSSYTLPGGENYREVLLTLPSDVKTPKGSVVKDNADPDYPFAVVVDGQVVNRLNTDERAQEYIQEAVREVVNKRKTPGVYQSPHFEEPNVLAHMRVNDRVVDGKPTLFVEEIQSDWHQAGRKKGYQGGKINQEIDDIKSQLGDIEHNAFFEYNPDRRTYDVFDDGMNYGGEFPTKEEAEQFVNSINPMVRRLQELEKTASQGVPDAPFKTSWHELTLKKALNEASTKGYDQIAFTTGKTQADRYDLSKKIDELSYEKIGDKYEITAIDKYQRPALIETVTEEKLPDIVGKELAEKIIKGAGNRYPEGSFSQNKRFFTGMDLEVGGEGMKGFYDTILPKSLDKIGKKYGAKVRKTTMDTPDGPVEVWAMDIPPEMRETISSQGQPLFQIGAGAAGLGTAGIMGLTSGEAEAGQ
jgi:hypothetical protein